jgi:hypothetical protein
LCRLKAQLQRSVPGVEPGIQNNADKSDEMQQYKDQIHQTMEREVSLHKSMSEQAMACIKADMERKVLSGLRKHVSSQKFPTNLENTILSRT